MGVVTCARSPPNGSCASWDVDRIREGTSEIQRLVVARALERRGMRAVIA